MGQLVPLYGLGSLAIPLALRGPAISASDISSAMVGEAEVRYNAEVAAGAKVGLHEFSSLDP